MLAKNQVDGTVTTDFKTEADLYEAALKEKSVLDFKKVMNFLSDDQQRIIRKSEVVNVQTGLNVTCYSLGHDAIGLALKNYIPQINLIKPKGRVFICYAKEDVKYAKKIYNDLKNEGIEAWLDEINLVPGQNWELEIKKAIKDSSYFLALFSSNSVSKRGYIHKELKIAFDLLAEFPASETFIIPARLDNCKPSDKELRNIHWADLFPSYEEGLKDILRIFGFKKSDKKKIIEDTIAKITDFDRSAYLPRKVLHIKDDIPENILLRSKLSQDIVNLVSKQNRIALTGDAGTGKTTTLKMIAWHFSKEDALFYPLLISLNKCSENLPLVKLLPLTWTGIPEKQLLIILDGLDEVDSRNRKNVIDEIEWLADSYPLSHIIVSCRTNFYQSGTLKGFSSYVFDELAYEEIQKYIEKKLHKWTDEFYKAIDQNQLGELLEIPFYLIYLVEIYQNDALPTNKAEIFERLLFERRQYDAEHFKTTLALDEKRNQIIDTLERLALCMETLCRNYITDDEFQQIIPDEDSREIIKYCTLWNAAKLQFEHNNFQEYLAARILSRQSFEIIKEFISFKPDYKKIIPSWVNTISFILSISDDQKLFNWILDNEPEIAVKFEPDKIEASDKIRIFKNIFNNYKRKQIWIDSEKFNFRELGRFGQSDEIIEFLLAEAENPAHYTTLNESIKLLWVMKLPEKFKQRAVNLLVSSALNNDIPEHVQNTPLLALADLKLNSREIVEKITSELRYSDNPWTRYGLYYFLHNSDYLDENIDVFLEGLKYLRFNRFDPLSNIKRPRLTNETWELKIGLTKDKSCESIKKILIHFEEHGMDLLNISLKDEDISIIADNASKAYYKDNSVFEYALNFFPVCRRSGQERANSFILFFDKTNTRLRAFQEILCKEDDGKWRLLAVLADEKCMNFFAEQYKENKITDSDVWNFQNNLALETNELYLPFNKLINEVSDNKFILPQRQNFEKEKKDRSRQHDINLLFDKQAFLDEIKHIFDSEQKQNLTSDELIHFYWPEKDYSDLAVEKLDSIADDQSVSYEQAVETINRWDWNWFCISNIYNYLINDEATKLSQKQEKWIADWCYSRIDKVDFKTENYVWDAIYLWYFLKRLDLNYPKNVLLDMLSFDYMHNDIECLEERLNKSDMTSRILENLEQGITVDNVLKNHIDYCKRHRIKQGIKFAIREIANTEKEKYDEVRRVALETVCELSYTLSELEEILPQITDDFKWNVINELVKNESEYVHNFLSEIFSAEKNEEKFKYAEYLIRFQNIDALKYYVDEIKREKKFSRSQYNTSPLHYLQTLEALPLLIDLLELTYHEDFNQEDNFERLDRLILDTLNRIALQSDHHYAEVKEAVNNFTDQYLSVYNKVNWLHSFLDRLEQKYYTNKSEQLTLEDIIRKLQKIK
ncbi:MAG: TIR domain-containing protein [Desulfobacterales bacterium]|nr:TIR domain-containing protein [Desulfobacterales bacterium]